METQRAFPNAAPLIALLLCPYFSELLPAVGKIIVVIKINTSQNPDRFCKQFLIFEGLVTYSGHLDSKLLNLQINGNFLPYSCHLVAANIINDLTT